MSKVIFGRPSGVVFEPLLWSGTQTTKIVSAPSALSVENTETGLVCSLLRGPEQGSLKEVLPREVKPTEGGREQAKEGCCRKRQGERALRTDISSAACVQAPWVATEI